MSPIHWKFWQRNREGDADQTAENVLASPPKIKLSDVPDLPVGFGYKTGWLAIKDMQPLEVAEKLCLRKIRKANWQSGLDMVYENGKLCFVSPPVDGWCFVVNQFDFGFDTPEHTQKTREILRILSADKGECHYYGTYRVVDYHAWGAAFDGKIIRAFGFIQDITVNEGELTAEEQDLDFPDYSGLSAQEANRLWQKTLLDDIEAWHISEDDVMNIAAAWSIDPTSLEDCPNLVPGVGLIGYL